MPTISIIIPIYKVPREYLDQCIENCIDQEYKNIEIILVDDGSPDNSGSICDEYAKEDKRIKVVHKENGGLVSARNAGYKVATGEWLMYLDGDDWIDKNTCKELIEITTKYPDVDIIFWNHVQELGNQSIKGKMEWKCEDEEHLYQNEECKMLALNTLMYTSGIATAYSKLIRSSYAKEKDIFHNPRLKQGSEGVEFSLKAFYYADKALFIKKYYNHYRYNPNSISKKIDERNTIYLKDCFQVMLEEIESFNDKKKFQDALYQRVAYVLIAIALSTYFHPDNNDSLLTKIRKYSSVIKDNKIFRDSVNIASTKGMDKLRIITFTLIRLRMYFMLDAISRLKQYFLKKGKYNY